MKNSKIVLNIISMICLFLACLTFILPSWYFAYNTSINEKDIMAISQTIKIYDFVALNKLANLYLTYGKTLEIIYAKIFYIFILITIFISIIFILLAFISLTKKVKFKDKLARICNILSIVIIALAIISLIIGIIFSIKSKATITDFPSISYYLSVNIASGVYLFTIFEIASAVCGNIACKLKESDD